MAETRSPAKRASTKKPSTVKKKPTMDAKHKAALAQGRQDAAKINRYLDALQAFNAAKRRGRRRTPESIKTRLDALEVRMADPTTPHLTLVKLHQDKIDLEKELASLDNGTGVNPDDYSADFVSVVKGYSDRKGITFGAWRNVGVPAELLRKAGVSK